MNKAVKMSILKTITGLLIAATLAACGGGGGEARTPTAVPTVASAASVSNILLTGTNPLSVSADGVSSITLTVRALDSSGGLVKGATVLLTSSAGSILSSSSVVTDATTGLATVALTADPTNQSTRVATVTANCSSCAASAASLQVVINGAALTLTNTGTTALTTNTSTTLSATLKDANGFAIPNVPVVFSQGAGAVVGFIAVAAGSVALLCLIAAIISLPAESPGDRRSARRFFYAFLACVLLIFLGPLFVNLLHLP